MKVTTYVREDYSNEKGESVLYLRVFLNRKYFFISLGVHVNPDNYDKKQGRFTKGKNRSKYNNLITSAIGKAADIELKYQVNNKILTRGLFEKEFSSSTTLTSFYSFMEEQIDLRKGEISEQTIKQQKACLSKLKSYKKECLMSELNEDFIRGFERFMRNKLKNKQNTINNTLKSMKIYINRAINIKLMTESPFRYYTIKKPKTYPEFLTEVERDSLVKLYQEGSLTTSLQNVLRWFLFSCYTGLRISDLKTVEYQNIKRGTLIFHPQKTINVNNNRVEVPLTQFAKQLIKDENIKGYKGLLFNCISDQKMNKYIKKIIDMVGIEKSISFHTARHTFATLFLKKSTKANGILILQKLLGHSNVTTTMIYSHVLNDDVQEAMKEFDA